MGKWQSVSLIVARWFIRGCMTYTAIEFLVWFWHQPVVFWLRSLPAYAWWVAFALWCLVGALYCVQVGRRREARWRAVWGLLWSNRDRWFRGYEISEELSIGSADLYDILDQLESDGVVEGRWVQENGKFPRRREYKAVKTGEL